MTVIKKGAQALLQWLLWNNSEVAETQCCTQFTVWCCFLQIWNLRMLQISRRMYGPLEMRNASYVLLLSIIYGTGGIWYCKERELQKDLTCTWTLTDSTWSQGCHPLRADLKLLIKYSKRRGRIGCWHLSLYGGVQMLFSFFKTFYPCEMSLSLVCAATVCVAKEMQHN